MNIKVNKKPVKSADCVAGKKAVMASKLFQSSTRKQKILAAMESPINQELLTQLEEYIGDEYKELLNPPKPVEEVPQTDPKQDAPADAESGAPASFSAPRGGRPSAPSAPADTGSESDGEAPADPYEDVPDEVLDVAMNQSAKANGTPIKASVGGIVNGYSYEAQINNLAGELKGTLNARQETAGVGRVLVKSDEIWMYYDESINLNNVLDAVIRLLTAANYYYVKFNRLARTDNAIVFTLEFNDSGETLGTIK